MLTPDKINRMKYHLQNIEKHIYQVARVNNLGQPEELHCIDYDLLVSQCQKLQEMELLFAFEYFKIQNPQDAKKFVLDVNKFANQMANLEQSLMQ